MERTKRFLTIRMGDRQFTTGAQQIALSWLVVALTFAAAPSQAQVTTAITRTVGAGDLGTIVTPSPTGVCIGGCVITGGTRPGGNGPNLFHSFGEFSVGPGDTAVFSNTTLLIPTSNILARVTGMGGVLTRSNIYGTIDTLSYPGANFFLMNPAGVIFGPNATLNVGGMASFTTADYVRLFNEVNSASFFANSANDGRPESILVAPLVDFGFLKPAFGFLNTPDPAATITVQGATLAVQAGQSLNLVGSPITVEAGVVFDPNTGEPVVDPDTGLPIQQPSSLLAPGGEIRLASAQSPGEFVFSSLTTGPNIAPFNQSFSAMGAITIEGGATVDVSGSPGGAIRILGGQFVMDGASLQAHSTVGTPAPNVIRVDIQGGIQLVNGSSISAQTTGAESGNHIEIVGNSLEVRDGSFLKTESATGAGGPPGNISVSLTGDLLISGVDAFDEPSRIQIDALGDDGGGAITRAITVNAVNATLADRGVVETRAFGSRQAPDITMALTRLDVTGGGGVDTLSATDLASSGTIRVSATDTISLVGRFDEVIVSRIENQNTSGDTGSIFVDTGTLNLSDHGRINSNTFQSSVAPTEPKVDIMAWDNMTLAGESRIDVTSFVSDVGALNIKAKNLSLSELSLITTQTNGVGASGPMNVTLDNLTVTGGSQLTSASTEGFGNGGPINILATGTVTLAGQGTNEFGEVKSSGIFSSTNGNIEDASLTGNAGNLDLTANILNIQDKARIDNRSNGFALGNAGDTSVSASTVTIDGGTIANSTEFEGNAGSTLILTGDLRVINGGRLTSSSVKRAIPLFEGEEIPTPTGAAGTITIEGTASPANSVTIDGAGSGIFTDTQGTGVGGNINLFAQSFTVQNGATISAATSSTAASATGGTILVNATLQGGAIMPTAAQSATLNNGASISATSTGPANAGDIVINAGQTYTSTNSSVTTQATAPGTEASGGNITVLATDMVQLTNSQINASVQGSTTTIGGTIVIDPQFVILQNSQILATATQGQGGNITITGGVVLIDPSSTINASSQFGVNGQVSIQSPVQNISTSLAPLPKNFQSAAALLAQRCAARASEGQFSTFVVAGRETAPVEPGGLLPSPAGLGGPAAMASAASSQSADLAAAPLRLAALEEACAR